MLAAVLVGTTCAPRMEASKGVSPWGMWQLAHSLSFNWNPPGPLLAEPLKPEHIKPRLLGCWSTTPGLNLYLCAFEPCHLEGSYSDFYPNIARNPEGLKRLFRQFSFPGGIPSHAAPETPGPIHEGGELGYSLAHAYGAVFDNLDLIACCVIGDGEGETGAVATSWHSNKFLNPARDSAVLPFFT
jgi:xylulose-5-phosphate/fructose-6-phosphate phosphoketolase